MPMVDRDTPNKEHVQSVIMSKDVFTESEARKWIKDNDFYSDGMDETNSSYRFRQYNPSSKFVYRSKQIAEGVVIVIGIPK